VRKLFHSFLRVVGVLIAIGFIVLVVLYFEQDRLIFHPRHYDPAASAEISRRYAKIEYRTQRNGRQFAYYRGPRNRVPEKLWILTGGNGSLALDWDFVSTPSAERNPLYGFLLVDYPGYGDCEGRPSRTGIQENMEGVILGLAAHLQTDPVSLKAHSSFLAHSLGCAVALETAAKWRRGEVIAVSPFTSMQGMARLTVVEPFPRLVRHRWDNVVAIQEISEVPGAEITVFHGMEDRVIPLSMSRELAGLFPGTVTLYPEPGMGHGDIVWKIRDELIRRISD